MPEKPTYEELEQKIKALEKEIFKYEEREKELKQSEKKYKGLFDNAVVALYRTRISDGKLIDINQRYAELAGYSSVESCKENFIASESYVDPNVRKKMVRELKKKGRIQNFEAQIRSKNGEKFWVSFSAHINNEEGYIEGVLIDITKRKRAEESLQEANNIINRSPAVAFLWKNTEGWPVEYVSENVVDLFGYAKDEFISGEVSYAEMIHPDDLEKVGNEVAMHSEKTDGNEFHHEPYRIITKMGDTKYIDDRTHIRRDENGTITHYEGVVLDISERVKVESEKERLQAELMQSHKMEAIGTLAGGIAHDFNNMLGIIIGNAELAMDILPDWNPARDNFEEIKIASLRAKDVVQQLLSFSRKTDHEKVPVNIGPIVSDVLKLLRSSIPTNIEIRKSISDNPGIIKADPTQIHQVMINLCTNAAHAMSENGGIMEVTLSSVEMSQNKNDCDGAFTQDRYIRITVSDTGHGIPEENLDKIFDPYFTTKEVGKGSGIGLSVVHGIVQDHKGLINANSEYGRGVTFSVFFPIVEEEPEFKMEIQETIPEGHERVLLVDDEKSIVNMIGQMLERLGYTVMAKTSSLEALETLRNQPDEFDLIISDMTMPEMTGDKLAKEFLKINPDIPIILCTGFSERIKGATVNSLGIRALIMKPIERDKLAKTIRKVLDVS